MPPVFYLGPEGTFSHILARQRFGRRANLIPCPTIDAIFESTLADETATGLVPIENSSGGAVYDSMDQLIRLAGKIFLHEELALDVRIALLGHKDGSVKTVFSHFTQIKHHADWLKARYPGVKMKEVVSTAVAAQKAAASKQSAALASPGAAEVYGLDLLERPAARHTVNVTHFFTFGTKPSPIPESGATKTALVVDLSHDCGSLHRFLGPFARQKVSLSRIVSRPVPGQPQTYVFLIEIEGGMAQPAVAKALARAKELSVSLINLGTYPIGRHYKS
jgi:chorismate mutase / prephenate dehydratase